MLIKVSVWVNLVLRIYPSYGPWKSLKSPWIWFWQMGKNHVCSRCCVYYHTDIGACAMNEVLLYLIIAYIRAYHLLSSNCFTVMTGCIPGNVFIGSAGRYWLDGMDTSCCIVKVLIQPCIHAFIQAARRWWIKLLSIWTWGSRLSISCYTLCNYYHLLRVPLSGVRFVSQSTRTEWLCF